MKILDFFKEFPDEESCKLKFKELKISQGIKCLKCGCEQYYWKNDKECFECKKCGHRTSLKSGTVMHKSKLPFRYWFIAMHLLTSTKKTFSSMEVQRQLGHKRYQPIWTMMHKLRASMGNRDSIYELSGEIELDEGFFSTDMSTEEKEKPLKRGRGSQKKTKVLVMAESQEVKDKKPGHKPRKVKYIKMKVIEDLKEGTINKEVEENVSPQSQITCDGSTSYNSLGKIVEKVESKVIPPKETGKVLPWVHIAISNAKRLFLDIHHHAGPDYLQLYLNEFCYRFNRRYFGNKLFDRILIAAVSYKNEFRYTKG